MELWISNREFDQIFVVLTFVRSVFEVSTTSLSTKSKTESQRFKISFACGIGLESKEHSTSPQTADSRQQAHHDVPNTAFDVKD